MGVGEVGGRIGQWGWIGQVRAPYRIQTGDTIAALNQIAVFTISGIPLRLYANLK